jgi:integrase/recombinase XerD
LIVIQGKASAGAFPFSASPRPLQRGPFSISSFTNAYKRNSRTRLFDEEGRRQFFSEEEREAFITAAASAPDTTQTFCSLLHYTGCNFTEALNLTALQVDFSRRAIVFEAKIRGLYVYNRAVPVSDSFIELLDQVHNVRHAQSGPQASERLWPQSKKTMHDKVSRVIAEAGISGGPHAVPKGIRHGFLVHAIRQRIILTRTAEWMGFSHIDYIGEYAVQLATHAPELVGDERADAALMW